MERRIEYAATAPESPEYHAAGLSLVEAELENCELREQLAVLTYQYLFALYLVRCLLRDSGRVADLTKKRGCV